MCIYTAIEPLINISLIKTPLHVYTCLLDKRKAFDSVIIIGQWALHTHYIVLLSSEGLISIC